MCVMNGRWMRMAAHIVRFHDALHLLERQKSEHSEVFSNIRV